MPSRYYTRTTVDAQPDQETTRLRQVLAALFRNSDYFFVFLDSRLADWTRSNSLRACRAHSISQMRMTGRSDRITDSPEADNWFVMNWPAAMARRLDGMTELISVPKVKNFLQ